MRKIRDLFVLNCHTGLRHSDWPKVTLENIDENKLYVKTQKTNEPVIIPVHPIIIEIINRYGSGATIPTNQEANRVLRWLGEYAVTKKITKGNITKSRKASSARYKVANNFNKVEITSSPRCPIVNAMAAKTANGA